MDLPDAAFAWRTCPDNLPLLLKFRIQAFVEFQVSKVGNFVKNGYAIRLVLAEGDWGALLVENSCCDVRLMLNTDGPQVPTLAPPCRIPWYINIMPSLELEIGYSDRRPELGFVVGARRDIVPTAV